MRMVGLRNMLVLLGLLLMTGLSAQYEKQEGVIRLMTYNVMYCKGNEGTGSFLQQNINRIGQVIKYLDPDMITLQELDSACNSRNRRFLLDEIRKATGMDYQVIYGNAAPFDGGSIGCGLLIKRSHKVNKIKKIALPGDEARMLVRAELDDLFFMGTHLDLNNDKRIMSASMINQELKYMRKPSFLGGDLNDSHRWSGMAFNVFLPTWSIVSSDEYTLSDANNKNTIDYLLYHDYQDADKFEVIDTKVVRGSIIVDNNTIELDKASDHLPVYVDIKYKNANSIEESESAEVKIFQEADKIYVKGEGEFSEKCRIFSAAGSLSRAEAFQTDGIDIAGLIPGLYIIELQMNKKKICRKFIK